MRQGLILTLALASFVLLPGCREEARPVNFSLFFTCDTTGRIEPCGCFTGQYGGLTRVSTFLKSEAPAGSLLVEVGNAIAGLADYEAIQFRHLLEAAGTMGYSAVNAGEREARLPVALLRDLAKSSPVPLLSANLLDRESGAPVWRPSLVVDHHGLRVGLIGVVDPDSLEGELDPGVRLGGMDESIRRELDLLSGKTDLLVCLAFTDEDGLERLARTFFEFDLILGGDVAQPSPSLSRVNQSWILATTNEARALGRIQAKFDPVAGKLADTEGEVTLMVDTIPEDPAIRAFSVAYRKEVRETPLAIDTPASDSSNRVPGVAPTASFVGSAACAACHPTSHGAWEKSGHARAFQSLLAKDSDADPGCIKCHTVGFGEPGGYLRSMGSGLFTGVGCESCHGPGSEHVAARAAASPGEAVLQQMRPVGQGQCLQCHHGEFSRPFSWEEFWPLIQHVKEAKAP